MFYWDCKILIYFFYKFGYKKEIKQDKCILNIKYMKQIKQKEKQQSQKQPHSQQQPKQQSSHESLFCENQFEKTKQFLFKLKRIEKDKLTQYKKKNKKLNEIFGIMSEFFMSRRKKNKQQRIKQKQKRLKQKQNRIILRKKALLNRIKNLKQGKAPEYLIQKIQGKVQPIVIEQQQKGNTQYSKDVKKSICYICSRVYCQIDNIYHQHCPQCSHKGKIKRFQTAKLQNLTALVTGARIKIGYQICLKLLRDGATVYATSRFTNDALLRYQKQPDYPAFKARLFLIQCDFMSSQQVNSLIGYIKQNVAHLDILIHNAAQTIARPPQFYTYELLNEQKMIEHDGSNLISLQNKFFPSISVQKALTTQNQQIMQRSSMIDLNNLDQFGQPLDFRPKNTWKQKIQDVSLLDCMSTQIINSTVPFFINGQLRQIMGGSKPSWIINVSSMEGVFYRQNKTCFHPHTNMAKASLNMMTRTCAQQMARDQIYMSSVDTGWVTNQSPLLSAMQMEAKHNFVPPLDCIEGAMRVLDPIYQGINQNKMIYGKFLKNYEQSPW